MNNLTYSNNGLAMTAYFEAGNIVPLTAYQDVVGIWTIGYGHTHQVHAGMICTLAQAQQWLAEDVQGSEYAVNRMVTVPVNQNQFDALVDFVFNLGSGALGGSTLFRKLNQGDYTGAAAEFPKWNHAGGRIVNGLTRRRNAEQAFFNTPDGQTPPDPRAFK